MSNEVARIPNEKEIAYLEKVFETISFSNGGVHISSAVTDHSYPLQRRVTGAVSLGMYGAATTATASLIVCSVIGVESGLGLATLLAAVPGFFLTAIPVFRSLKNYSEKIKLLTTPRVAAWLKESYDAVFFTEDLSVITEIILKMRPLQHDVFLTDKREAFQLVWNDYKEEWRMHKVFDNQAQEQSFSSSGTNLMIESTVSKTVTTESIGIEKDKMAGKYSEDRSTTLKNMEDFDEPNSTLDRVRKTIALLLGFELSAEDAHVVNRAFDDVNESVSLAKQLRVLEDEEYVTILEDALKTIELELEAVMLAQRVKVKERLTQLNNYYRNRK